jgi:hypothetical protein
VEVSSPVLHVEVDEDEYRVCCAVIGENFAEEGELPSLLFDPPAIVVGLIRLADTNSPPRC